MNRVRNLVAIFLAIGAVLPAICRSETTYLKEMP